MLSRYSKCSNFLKDTQQADFKEGEMTAKKKELLPLKLTRSSSA